MDFSILIGGEAGKGVKWAAEILGKFFTEKGFWTFVYNDYPSVIRGGHNFSVVRVSEEKIYSTHNKIDCLIAFDLNTVKLHSSELNKNGKIICDISLEKDINKISGGKVLSFPILSSESPNSAAVSAMISAYDFKVGDLFEFFRGRKAEENIEAAKKVHLYFKKNYKSAGLNLRADKKSKIFLEGSEVIAEGMLAAGLKNYFAYPMTPSTAVLHYLAKNQDRFGIVIQPENEIAVANMALGSIYAGSRTAVGTSGGGFDLMHECFSLAGMAELPLVVIMAQRPGPSTGLPTNTMQSDLMSVIYGGHGEFPRIVIAPATIEDAYYWSGRIIELSWQFQVPSILLVDKQITECSQSIELEKIEYKFSKDSFFAKGSKRYQITPSGISNFILPGIDGNISKSCSYEHNEFGISKEDAENVKKMQEKRLKKKDSLVSELKKERNILILGEKDSKNVVFCWGSTLGAVLEAKKLANKKFKIIVPVLLEPFPDWELKSLNANKIICVENNATGQLAGILKQNLCICDIEKILNYDGKPFDPFMLAEKLKEALK